MIDRPHFDAMVELLDQPTTRNTWTDERKEAFLQEWMHRTVPRGWQPYAREILQVYLDAWMTPRSIRCWNAKIWIDCGHPLSDPEWNRVRRGLWSVWQDARGTCMYCSPGTIGSRRKIKDLWYSVCDNCAQVLAYPKRQQPSDDEQYRLANTLPLLSPEPVRKRRRKLSSVWVVSQELRGQSGVVGIYDSPDAAQAVFEKRVKLDASAGYQTQYRIREHPVVADGP